jgi:SAM-dependent methyltransferase
VCLSNKEEETGALAGFRKVAGKQHSCAMPLDPVGVSAVKVKGNSEIRYEFGDNWRSYARAALSDTSVRRASTALQQLLDMQSLHGKTFMDIGCGSGLHALVACKLGASQVICFDFDPISVEVSKSVLQSHGIPDSQCQIMRGSILDPLFMETLPKADIVYSWGVLHHTGAMWDAIEAALAKVNEEGIFAIAIYNRVDGRFVSSERWHTIKRLYNRSPRVGRYLLELAYTSSHVIADTLYHRDPLRTFRSYSQDESRGMDFWHDAKDWLGGLPYEYASTSEIIHFVERQGRFVTRKVVPSSGKGCNEFLFAALGR